MLLIPSLHARVSTVVFAQINTDHGAVAFLGMITIEYVFKRATHQTNRRKNKGKWSRFRGLPLDAIKRSKKKNQ